MHTKTTVTADPADAWPRARALRAIAVGGLSAGALDISAAFLVYGLRGASPMRILQSVASGVYGAPAFQGGARTAALGLLLHFFIAATAAAVYFVASTRAGVLVRRPFVCGALYGIAVYLFMNRVVLPLSAVAKRPFSPRDAAILVVIHMTCVGIPIALAARRYAGATGNAGAA